MVIKSTVPVGYTARLKAELGRGNIFSANFCARRSTDMKNSIPRVLFPVRAKTFPLAAAGMRDQARHASAVHRQHRSRGLQAPRQDLLTIAWPTSTNWTPTRHLWAGYAEDHL